MLRVLEDRKATPRLYKLLADSPDAAWSAPDELLEALPHLRGRSEVGHLDETALSELIDDELAECHNVVPYLLDLLRPCPICYRRLWHVIEVATRLQPLTPAQAWDAFDSALRPAEVLLHTRADHRRDEIRREPTRFGTRAVAVRLLALEEELRFTDVRRGLAAAETAAWIAEEAAKEARVHLAASNGRNRGSHQCVDLLVMTEARLANAWRYNSDIREALLRFRRVQAFLSSWTIEKDIEAEALWCHGMALSEAGLTSDALAQYERAIQLAPSALPTKDHVLGQIAETLRRECRPAEEVLSAISLAVEETDSARSPRMAECWAVNQAFYALVSGDIQKAEVAFLRLQPSDPLMVCHGRALEGSIALEKGDLAAAELAFETATKGFLSLNRENDAALSSLYLGETRALSGRRDYIEPLLAAACTFEAAGAQEVVAALQRLIQRESAAAAEIRTIAAAAGGWLSLNLPGLPRAQVSVRKGRNPVPLLNEAGDPGPTVTDP